MADDLSRTGNFQELNPKMFLQSLFDESSTPKHPLGTIRELSDGRRFVYGKAGAANLAVGVLVQGAVHTIANQGNMAVANNANIGDRVANVTMGDLATTANMYAEGFLHINTPAANGGGYAYKILSHPAANANAACSYKLYDALRANIHSAASKATISKHPFCDMVIMPSPPTQAVKGVTVGPVTANYYAWFQTRGPAPVLANGTIVAGDRVYTSTAVDGAVSPSSGNAVDMALEQFVGHVITVDANAHYAMIDLNLP